MIAVVDYQKKEITILKEENTYLQDICINCGSSSTPGPVGPENVHKSLGRVAPVVNGNNEPNKNHQSANNIYIKVTIQYQGY